MCHIKGAALIKHFKYFNITSTRKTNAFHVAIKSKCGEKKKRSEIPTSQVSTLTARVHAPKDATQLLRLDTSGRG